MFSFYSYNNFLLFFSCACNKENKMKINVSYWQILPLLFTFYLYLFSFLLFFRQSFPLRTLFFFLAVYLFIVDKRKSYISRGQISMLKIPLFVFHINMYNTSTMYIYVWYIHIYVYINIYFMYKYNLIRYTYPTNNLIP